MLLTYIFVPIAVASFGTVVFIVARHWKEIRLLDPMTIKEERERQKRENMITRRFERVRADRMMPIKRLGRHLHRKAKEAYTKTYQRMQSFEALYHNAKSPFASLAPSTRDRIKTLVTEARSLVRDLKWAEAERRLLEVLSLDQRHADAYKLLGQMYLKQKLYPQAKETFEFLIKLKKADDASFAGLAEIAESDEDFAKAESMRLKAVEVSPKQSFRYAELAAFYLSRNEPAKAWTFAKRASDLEPTSAKYLELSLDIAVRLNDRAEARRRYDRLRLLSEDRSRFQTWREKVEALEAGTVGKGKK
jgi:tetratricopeptide (TPR) repeat protein